MDNIIVLAILVAMLASLWKIYEKAGEEGWTSLVPFYNMWVWIHMVGRPAWFIILCFIPIANIYAACALINDVSKGFGKGIGYTLGIIFLPFIFLPLLGFGDAQWTKPRSSEPAAPGSTA